MLIYAISAAPPVDSDVVERQLTIDVGNETPKVVTFPSNATSLGEVQAEQGATVTLSLVDLDDAGNPSEPAVVEFVATDTIPPAQPGQFGVTLVREE
jgi:hypothetical protein